MTRKEFLEDVVNEVNHLIDNARQVEKDMLNEISFNPNDFSNCIYGLMTGCCSSSRAKELMPKKYSNINHKLYIKKGIRNKDFIHLVYANKHPEFTALEILIMDEHDIGIHLLRKIRDNKKVSYRYVRDLNNKYR